MKKFLALLLAMMMVLSLAACGGSDEPAGSDSSANNVASEPTGDAVTITDRNGEEVSQETIAELTAAYNAIAVPFNELVATAKENGWTEDEQTMAELDAVANTLSFVGTGLTEDITMLEGTDFEAALNALENEFPAAIEQLAERVSVPYEG